MTRFIEKDLINSPKTIQELFMILYQPPNVKHILQREGWISKVPLVLPLHLIEKSIGFYTIFRKTKSK